MVMAVIISLIIATSLLISYYSGYLGRPSVSAPSYGNVTQVGGFGVLSPGVSRVSEVLRKFAEAAGLITGAGYYGYVPRTELALVTVTSTATPSPLKEPPTIPEYSVTNVQVLGVDEHDIVKSNGTHIFVASGDRFYVLRAHPPDKMAVELVVNVTNDVVNILGPIVINLVAGGASVTINASTYSVNVHGLYIYGDRVIAVATVTNKLAYLIQSLREFINVTNLPPYILYPTAWVLTYLPGGGLADYAWVTGRVTDSRMSGGKVVLVATAEPAVYPVKVAGVVGISYGAYSSWGRVPEESVAVLGLPVESTTNVLLINVSSGKRCVTSVAGPRAKFIYLTPDGDLYIASPAYWYRIMPKLERVVEVGGDVSALVSEVTQPSEFGSTSITYVSTANDSLTVRGFKVLEGFITTQFAVDVYEGVLRVALQRGWNRGFNLYTLDASTLDVLGNLTGVADGERIHGVRFVGSRLYIVTYRTVDPLFVIDLSKPTEPSILGYRKGPGFDEYLHPWNETSLIGLGFTDERDLRVTTYRVNPNASIDQLSQVVIKGEHWSVVFSEGGHHAFLLDRKHNLILFPGESRVVVVVEDGVKKVIGEGGVHVISIDPETLKLSYVTLLKHLNALRELYIGDTIYTVSNDVVKAYSIPELRVIAEVELK